MSVLSELNRINDAKTAIANAIKNKGVTVPSTAKIGDLAPLISSIRQGSGDGEAEVDTCTFEIDYGSYGAIIGDDFITVIYTPVDVQGNAVGIGSAISHVKTAQNTILNNVPYGSHVIVILPQPGGKVATGTVEYQTETVFVLGTTYSQGKTQRVLFFLDD